MSTQIGSIEKAEDVVGGDTYTVRRGLYIDTAGVVVLVQPDGTNQTYSSLAVGVWLPIQSISIVAAGTTATGIKVGN